MGIKGRGCDVNVLCLVQVPVLSEANATGHDDGQRAGVFTDGAARWQHFFKISTAKWSFLQAGVLRGESEAANA
jgi:hypothetical protein